MGRICYIQEGEAYLLQGLAVDFEGFSSIGILLVPFLRAIYFFLLRRRGAGRQIERIYLFWVGGGGSSRRRRRRLSFLASFLLIFYY